jgi:hypothetical protein
MNEWINIQDQLPTSGEPQKDNGPHIHCWCAINDLKEGYFVQHLAWNPYYQCWDSEDEDDVSRFSKRVSYWQLFIVPSAPKVYHDQITTNPN